MTMADLEALLSIALDLTASLAAADRYARLLAAVRRAVPCDAATLLRLEGSDLVPVAAHGLVTAAATRRYRRTDHPRLDAILAASGPVIFPPDSRLPDPFDGLLLADPAALRQIHACLGCPLVVEGEVVGALTADALDPRAFDHLDTGFLATLGALAGAALRTTALIEALERRAAHERRVARELGRDAERRAGGEILGTSPAIEAVRREIDIVGHTDMTVLVLGETGVGKELVARAVHAASRRRDDPLIHVNCAALPESVAESELFGHVRGAFTGAAADRAGKFEVADRGTLLLDEVGELPQSVQPKLLRALQTGEIQRVGDDRAHHVDVRIVAATNRDLEAEVRAGRFRADLFHRLFAFPLRVPPLRERRDDVPLLAGYFLDRARRHLGLGPVRLAPGARDALRAAEWPGNVRELENVLGRAVLRAAAAAADPRREVLVGLDILDIGPSPASTTDSAPAIGAARADEPPPAAARAAESLAAGVPLRDAVDDFQRTLIRAAVARAGGNWAAAARHLGLHRSNLHHLARRLDL
jgi:anaerobic nitric oxide reductase transcription regulator